MVARYAGLVPVRGITRCAGSRWREEFSSRIYLRPTEVVLSDTTVVEPDILFVSSQRGHIIARENIQGAPDLVVEVFDPATAERDRMIKLDPYARRGVKESWLGEPDATTITVLLRGESRYEVSGFYGEGQSLRSSTLAGFSVDLVEAFKVIG